jgi:hypothetical protein
VPGRRNKPAKMASLPRSLDGTGVLAQQPADASNVGLRRKPCRMLEVNLIHGSHSG